jgi:NADH-quinone oxidoreductase subunit M
MTMAFLRQHLLSTVLFTPLAGAIVLLFVGARRENTIRWIASACGVLGFAVSIPLWFRFQPFGDPWQFVERVEWIPSIGAAYLLGADGFSALLVMLATLIGAIAIVSSWTAITERVKEYYVVLLILQTGLIGAFVALDALLFFLFCELMLVPASFLIGVWGGSRRLRSSIKFFFFAMAGSLVMLLGILGLYVFHHTATGVYTFDITQFHRLSVPVDVQRWIFLTLFVGFAVRTAVLPFHVWLPDAHTDAPTAGSVLLASGMLWLGTYGFIRFSLPILPDATRQFAPIVSGVAAAGLIYGALVALAQTDWKRAIAYSSVSQMGMVVLGLFALTPAGLIGGIVQQISHALSITALFLMTGMIFERRRSLEISEYGGVAKVMPIFATVFLIMTMTSIGLPALSGFIGQILILQGLYVVHHAWAAIAALGIVLGTGYMLWLYQRTMLGKADNPLNRTLRDLNGREIATLLPLVALAVWIGVHPEPLLRRLQSSVGRVVVRVSPVYGPAIAKAEADCNATAAPAPVPDAPAGLMAAPPCDTPVASPSPAGR